MALQIITSTIVGPGAGVDLGTTDDLFLTSAGLIGSTGSAGVFSYSGDHSVTIAGEIWAKANGIQLGTSAGTPVFKTGTFNHSVTSPYIIVQQIFKVMGLSGTVFGKPAIEIKNFNHA